MFQDEEESLKLKFISVTKLNLKKARAENELRNTERILSEELQITKAEIEFMYRQMEELKQEIAKAKCQIAVIGICEVSEKSKIDNHISNLTQHKKGYEELFSKENEAIKYQEMEIKKRKEEEKQEEQLKQKEIEEQNQMHLRETVLVEEECNAIEQECAVLQKRNKAIRLKLRRKLIESEDLRRKLMKNA